MGFWSGLGKALSIGGSLIPGVGPILGAAGAGLGAISQGQANNRGEKLAGQMDLERLLMDRDESLFGRQLAREQEGRAGSSDAWRKLLSAQRLMNPGSRPQLSPYSVAPRQSSTEELSGADALTREVLARLQGGNPIPQVTERPMNVDPSLMDPGVFERIAGYASPALSYLGRQPQTIANSRGDALARILAGAQAPRV